MVLVLELRWLKPQKVNLIFNSCNEQIPQIMKKPSFYLIFLIYAI